MSSLSLDSLKKDFRNFLFYFWHHAVSGSPKPTPCQYDIATVLQNPLETRLILQAFRGIGKTTITQAYVLWRLLNNKEEKILTLSCNQKFSDQITGTIQKFLMELSIFSHLCPDSKDRSRWATSAFDVKGVIPTATPTVKGCGIHGNITGSRASIIIADDVEVLTNSITQSDRDKILHNLSEFSAIMKPEDTNNVLKNKIIFLGTPHSEDSIYNKLAAERGYKLYIWPARYPSLENIPKYNGNLAPFVSNALARDNTLHNKPLEPSRFDESVLIKNELEMGRTTFNLQFMLDTTLSDLDRYPLKTSDLIITDLSAEKAPLSVAYGSSDQQLIKDDLHFPRVGFNGDKWFKPMFFEQEFAPYEQSVMAIDPSGKGTDETSYAIVKQLQGKLFLLDIGGFSGGYNDDVLTNLAKKAKEYSVNVVLVESNWGDGMFNKIFTPVLMQYHRCSLEEVKHSIQKEKRIIDTLEPVLNQHRLVASADCVKRDLKLIREDKRFVYSLFYQLTRITRDRNCLKHDDRLDALAMAVKYYSDSMKLDETKALTRYKDKLLDEQLKGFMKSCNKVFGNKTKTFHKSRF